MKTKIISLFIFALALCARAQVDTNFLVLSGAGNNSVNGIYEYDPNNPGITGTQNGYYYEVYPVTNGFQIVVQNNSGVWAYSDLYWTTNFPAGPWYTNQFGVPEATNPPPVGSFLMTNSVPLWAFYMTNYFPEAGDMVSFNAIGRNMGLTNNFPTNMAQIEIRLDVTNVVYLSTLSAGNGSPFSVYGRLEWDGSNMNTFCQFDCGDPLNQQTAQFNTFSNYVVGTNKFSILPYNNTNGFILLSAELNASRVPTNAIAPLGLTKWTLGSASFVITN